MIWWRGMGLVAILLLSASFALARQDTATDMFVEASVSNAEPYPGEQILYTVRFWDAAGTANALYSPADFEGFWRTDPSGQQQLIKHPNGQFYTVTDVTTALFPIQAGTVTITGAGVMLPATVFEDKRLLPAPAVEVRVRELPAGAPQGFAGAVGQFALRVQADSTTVDAGDPVQVMVTVEGTGYVDALALPDVVDAVGWRWTVTDTQVQAVPQAGVLIGTKTFRVAFVPDQPGERSIPPFRLVYFDPLGGTYQTLVSDAIPVSIRANIAPDVIASASSPDAKSELKAVEAVSDSGAPAAVWWLIPPLISAAGGGVWFWKRQQKTREPQQRRERAYRMAMARLASARLAGTDEALRETREALRVYGAATGQPMDWLMQLPETESLRVCVEQLDAARYAPQSSEDARLLLDRVSAAFAMWQGRQGTP